MTIQKESQGVMKIVPDVLRKESSGLGKLSDGLEKVLDCLREGVRWSWVVRWSPEDVRLSREGILWFWECVRWSQN